MSQTTIYCFNKSTVLKDSDMFLMISAINTMLPAFCSTWSLGGKQYICQAAPSNTVIAPTGLYCVFLDNSDVASALAYHTENSDIPVSKVFVKTIQKYGGQILSGSGFTVSQAFSHEIFEMIVNMNVNGWWQISNNFLVPAEVSDPVQGNIVRIQVGSTVVYLSDYILPAWSDPQAKRGPYNYLNTLTKPFQVARGGYVITMRCGVTSAVYGAEVTDYVKDQAAHDLTELSA